MLLLLPHLIPAPSQCLVLSANGGCLVATAVWPWAFLCPDAFANTIRL